MIKECREIRKYILDISRKSGHGHIPTCFSIVEILYAVYETMKHNSNNPGWAGRDIFILSKGHGSLAHYCVLAEFGYFDIQKVYSFGSFMSEFGCHAERSKVPGVEFSTGSLGHGIGIAVGVALAFKIQKSKRQVYTVIGDGEANEGSVWEAILVAENLKLNNLTVIYDNNKSQVRGLQIQDPVAHFSGFGAEVLEVDGHDVTALKQALARSAKSPKVIVANTQKGYGSRTLVENQHEWHRKSPNEVEFKQLMEELNEEAI